MTLLWTLFGIALALGIARYNQSNKLFWQLVLAFIVGYAGTVMYTRTFNSDEEGKKNLTQVYPTQVSKTTLGSTVYLLANDLSLTAKKKVTASAPVSQDNTPEASEIDLILSKVFGKTRDQPMLTLIKPPELCFQKVISTLHDYG